ncbi:Predicted DNA-binding transcriptional regulator YafY, contains an HTH and WYL domains [Sphingobacterium nematocida]|uniref:Predicted DNA-binding transcriptional regulator YafY, contains an HTH and WYL domains n=1 Tax=Sphingobacterium nematocida TaxID=1513896 RepID=A0A1T5B1B2_9SPHI|nr:WYL domain-containing protein [Sphingobacterium nematocida]SKB40879.1 Predicted DNA-binding transcriptional regulator YafY, contains an HTH and WYL domains [Sphingobacterium nematocida]
MATNKQASIRYRILDNCLSNPQKRFSFQDLLDCLDTELSEINANHKKISVRTLREDIKYMRSREGGSAPIEVYKQDGKSYYRYTDKGFKLYNQGLNSAEVQQLKSAIDMLSKIEGLPQMGWLQEMGAKLEEVFFLEKTEQLIMSHDNNRYLKGIEYLGTLFHAILYKKCVLIRYKSFKASNETVFEISPYHLREFNNRWFLFGRNSEYQNLTNLALDRIIAIEETSLDYIENTEWDFSDYFEDIVGVSFSSSTLEEVHIWFNEKAAPYVLSKPLHGSQKVVSNDANGLVIKLDIIPNYELETLILSFGERAKVLSPDSFRESLYARVKAMYEGYANK